MGAGRESRKKNGRKGEKSKVVIEQAAKKRQKKWNKQRLQSTCEALDRNLSILYDAAMGEQPTLLPETTENNITSVVEKIRHLGSS